MKLKLNAERFTGEEYVNLYDKYRPNPPVEIIHQTLNYLNKPKADLVIDLGCGTGISTEIWSDYAEEVKGIEPSQEMITIAKNKERKKSNINYLSGFAHKIPLPSKSADVISCSQSFHWMEPISTLNEINRTLKENGVFLVYDVIWSPSVNFEYENSYFKLFERAKEKTKELNETISMHWSKKEHLVNIKKSQYFKFSKETFYHKTERLSKEQFIGIALSQGGLEALLKRGYTKDEIGITKFEKEINSFEIPFFEEITYNYVAIFSIK